MINIYTINTLRNKQKYFTKEGANFQEGVVKGKMNSETVGQKVTVNN